MDGKTAPLAPRGMTIPLGPWLARCTVIVAHSRTAPLDARTGQHHHGKHCHIALRLERGRTAGSAASVRLLRGILTLDYDPRILRATLHPVHHVLGEVVFGAALNDDFVIESGHSYIFQQSVGSGGRDSEELLDDQFTALASLLNQHDMSFQLLHFALRKLAELVIKGQRLQKDKERADEEARERTRRRDWIWKVAAVIGAVMLFVAAVSMAPDVAGGAKAAVNYFLGLLASVGNLLQTIRLLLLPV